MSPSMPSRPSAADIAADRTMVEWEGREREKVKIIIRAREDLNIPCDSADTAFHNLVTYLQAVRRATRRPEMKPEQIALIPRDQEFLKALTDIACSPLSFNPECHSMALAKVEPSCVQVGLEDLDTSEYYLQQFIFPSKDDAILCIAKATSATPQYRFISARILQGLSSAPEGEIRLSYGGYTLAIDTNTAIRASVEEGDFFEEPDAYLHSICQAYAKEPVVYTFPALKFAITSVIDARADKRTSLFHALVVDSLGLSCVNTAPPGQVIELTLTPSQEAMLEMVRNYVPDPKIYDGLRELARRNKSNE